MKLPAPGRRHSLLIFAGSALLLPVIAVLAFQLVDLNRDAGEEVEREAVQSAHEITQHVEGVAKADLMALRVLAANVSPDDLRRSTDILNTAIQINPFWRSVVLYERETGEVVLDVAKKENAGGRFRAPRDLPDTGLAEGVSREGLHCPCVRLHAPLPEAPGFALTAFIDPMVFQELMLREIPAGSVGGIVDREGEFLARSIDYDARVGLPATQYVRDAVAKGGEGIYRGQTYEGFVNYTAYAMSEETGWSSHVAINHALIDRPQGMSMTLLLAGAIICLAIAAGMIAYVNIDMATRRREEERAIDMQKAEAVSQFTSTMVHDFRNLLAVMHASVNMIISKTEEKHTRDIAESARDVLDRSEKLITQFLTFARRDGSDLTLINLRLLLSRLMDLMAKSVGPGVKITVEAPENFCFYGNVQQIELAFVNLVSNARDAMEGRGRVSIFASVEGEDGVIRISDTGPGVPRALRQRIFEPFYTTKPAGKGTGLGLAQAQAALRQAGASIEVGEAIGGQFVIRVPLAQSGNVVELAPKTAG
jgi:signal transduction histidine kinase